MTWQPEIHLRIASRFEDLELVDQLMETLLHYIGLGQDETANTALAVREAAANALQHGNRLDSDKPADIRVSVDSGWLTAEVSDEGPGFDPDSVPDPLAPENLLKPTGRGLLLMRNFMDEVSFEFPETAGTVVRMRKKIRATDQKDLKEK
jgi:serine/threonine-protein kinase RsbW